MITYEAKPKLDAPCDTVALMAKAMRDLDQHGITVTETELRRRGFTKSEIEAHAIDAAARAEAMDVRHVA